MSALFVELYVQLRVDSEKIRCSTDEYDHCAQSIRGSSGIRHRRAQNRMIRLEKGSPVTAVAGGKSLEVRSNKPAVVPPSHCQNLMRYSPEPP